MKHDKRSPCASCPYRRDAPLAFWDADHFKDLLANDAQPLMGAMYNCHEGGKKPVAEREFCVGWLLDQKARGIPSIQLRLKLGESGPAAGQFKLISAKGLKMWKSLRAMCEANLKVIDRGKRSV